MPRIFGLGRASTDKQVITPEAQHGRVELFIKFQKDIGTWGQSHEMAGFFCDKAVSGGLKMRLRPYGNYIFTHAQAGDIVIAADFDRCFRDTVDFLETTRIFKDRKIGLYLLDIGNAPIDMTEPAQEAMLTCMAAFKQYERRNIGKRINDAFNHLRATRGVVRPKHGWKLIPNPHNSKEKIAVPNQFDRKLAAWIAVQKEAGRSWKDIWRELAFDKDVLRQYGRKELSLTAVRGLHWSLKHGWPQTGSAMLSPDYVRPKRAPCLDTMDS